MRNTALGEFLTDEQIEQCIAAGDVDGIEKVIAPLMPTINEKLGQENDSRYLAYAIYYVLTRHWASK